MINYFARKVAMSQTMGIKNRIYNFKFGENLLRLISYFPAPTNIQQWR